MNFPGIVVKKCLLIGAGGLGSQAVNYGYYLANQVLPLDPQHPNYFKGFVAHCFDTAQDYDFCKEGLNPELHCTRISSPELIQILKDAKQTGRIESLGGLPPIYIDPLLEIFKQLQNPDDGAGTTRPISHLAIIHTGQENKPYYVLRDKIQSMIEQGSNLISRCGYPAQFQEGETVYVYIVASAFGGTGSGIIPYIASSLRLLQQVEFCNLKFSINLILVLPDGLMHDMDKEKRQRVVANTTGFLREINAYVDGHPIKAFNILGNNEYHVFSNQYAEDSIINQVCLLNYPSREEAATGIGRFLFYLCTTQIGVEIRADIIDPQAISASDRYLPKLSQRDAEKGIVREQQPAIFMSFSTRRIQCDKDLLAQPLRYRSLEKIVESMFILKPVEQELTMDEIRWIEDACNSSIQDSFFKKLAVEDGLDYAQEVNWTARQDISSPESFLYAVVSAPNANLALQKVKKTVGILHNGPQKKEPAYIEIERRLESSWDEVKKRIEKQGIEILKTKGVHIQYRLALKLQTTFQSFKTEIESQQKEILKENEQLLEQIQKNLAHSFPWENKKLKKRLVRAMQNGVALNTVLSPDQKDSLELICRRISMLKQKSLQIHVYDRYVKHLKKFEQKLLGLPEHIKLFADVLCKLRDHFREVGKLPVSNEPSMARDLQLFNHEKLDIVFQSFEDNLPEREKLGKIAGILLQSGVPHLSESGYKNISVAEFPDHPITVLAEDIDRYWGEQIGCRVNDFLAHGNRSHWTLAPDSMQPHEFRKVRATMNEWKPDLKFNSCGLNMSRWKYPVTPPGTPKKWEENMDTGPCTLIEGVDTNEIDIIEVYYGLTLDALTDVKRSRQFYTEEMRKCTPIHICPYPRNYPTPFLLGPYDRKYVADVFVYARQHTDLLKVIDKSQYILEHPWVQIRKAFWKLEKRGIGKEQMKTLLKNDSYFRDEIKQSLISSLAKVNGSKEEILQKLMSGGTGSDEATEEELWRFCLDTKILETSGNGTQQYHFPSTLKHLEKTFFSIKVTPLTESEFITAMEKNEPLYYYILSELAMYFLLQEFQKDLQLEDIKRNLLCGDYHEVPFLHEPLRKILNKD